MANSYTKLNIHLIIVVKGRANIILPNRKDELYKYITGIITNKGHKLLTINGMPDHLHILIGIKPNQSISDIARDIKSNSSKFINERNWVKGKFEWQAGFSAFTVGYSQVEMVFNYIKNQEIHHNRNTFREEYIELLRSNDIEYKDEYLFEEVK